MASAGTDRPLAPPQLAPHARCAVLVAVAARKGLSLVDNYVSNIVLSEGDRT